MIHNYDTFNLLHSVTIFPHNDPTSALNEVNITLLPQHLLIKSFSAADQKWGTQNIDFKFKAKQAL